MLTLQPVDDASRSILHHLFIHYFVALSEFDPNLTINVYGLPAWIPHGLPGPTSWQECIEQNWWIRADCDQWLFFKDQQNLAGFAIVFTDPVRLSPGVDIELVDFYIVPEQRGTGLAREAALSIFERYRGMWQVFQLEKNMRARRFWERVIGEYTQGNFKQLDDGTQQRFNNRNL